MYVFELQPSFDCQYDCDYCFNKEANYFNIEKIYNMKVSDYINLFDNINLVDSYNLIISGGEPLYYPHICELMLYIKQHSKAKSIKLITNFKDSSVVFNNIDLFVGYNYNYTLSFHSNWIDDIDIFISDVIKFKSLIHKQSIILVLLLITNNDNINRKTINYLNKLQKYINNIKIKPINNLNMDMIKKYKQYLLMYDELFKINYNICYNKNIFKGYYCNPNNFLGILSNGSIKSSCCGLLKDENFIIKKYNKVSIHNLLNKTIQCEHEFCWCPESQIIKKWSK